MDKVNTALLGRIYYLSKLCVFPSDNIVLSDNRSFYSDSMIG